MVAAFAGRTRVGDLIVDRKQIGAPNEFAQMSDGFCVTSSSRGSAHILTQTCPSCATQIKLMRRGRYLPFPHRVQRSPHTDLKIGSPRSDLASTSSRGRQPLTFIRLQQDPML